MRSCWHTPQVSQKTIACTSRAVPLRLRSLQRLLGYGTLLVDALELDRVPRALDLALARVQG